MDRRPGFKPYGKASKFKIEHYAGSVEYDVTDFVKKNLDELSNKITELLRGCRFGTLARLSQEEENRMVDAKQEQRGTLRASMASMVSMVSMITRGRGGSNMASLVSRGNVDRMPSMEVH